MSMNLSVYAQGVIVTPNGRKRQHRERGPLAQTRTEDSNEIVSCSGTEAKYNLYRKRYGDPGRLLKKWLASMEADGFEVVWEVH
jgi:hypothetical protein